MKGVLVVCSRHALPNASGPIDVTAILSSPFHLFFAKLSTARRPPGAAADYGSYRKISVSLRSSSFVTPPLEALPRCHVADDANEAELRGTRLPSRSLGARGNRRQMSADENCPSLRTTSMRGWLSVSLRSSSFVTHSLEALLRFHIADNANEAELRGTRLPSRSLGARGRGRAEMVGCRLSQPAAVRPLAGS